MDNNRFDNWARQRAKKSPGARPSVWPGATGLAAAMTRVLPSTAQGSGPACQMAIQALTSAGPSNGTAYSGVLEISVGQNGAIDTGSLAFDGGPTVTVVGESDGRALELRATFPNGNALVLTGVGEKDIATCSGALSGVFGGPELGDTGSWMVDPAESHLSGAVGGVVGGAGALATPTPCPDMVCDDPFVLDPNSCQCGCRPPYEVCGHACCPGGSECTDPNEGECSCPVGTELCNDTCVPLCETGYSLDTDSCACVEGCIPQSCNEGEDFDETTCSCINICPADNPYYCQGYCYPTRYYSCTSGCVEASQTYSNPNLCGPGCTVCPAGMPCIGGTCRCPVDYSYCSGAGCYDLTSDGNNCGSCGNVCQSGLSCIGAVCKES